MRLSLLAIWLLAGVGYIVCSPLTQYRMCFGEKLAFLLHIRSYEQIIYFHGLTGSKWPMTDQGHTIGGLGYDKGDW